MRLAVILGLVLLVAVPSVLSGPSLAQESGRDRIDADPEGKPPGLAGRLLGYWIWRDSDGYHLRATTENKRHIFSGWVEVDRDFALQPSFKQEGNDYVRKTGRRIEFRFATAGNPDGFDFKASWPHRTTFFLEIDGRSGGDVLNRVFIGGRSAHPTSNPFAITPAVLRGMEAAGRPEAYQSGEPKAFWIWRDSGGYHLRATTGRERHVFSGWIEADSGLDLRKIASMESTDFVVREGRRLYFHLAVRGAEDGFDFSGSGPVMFFLMIDGVGSDDVLGRIFVGRKGVHPRDNPFRVR